MKKTIEDCVFMNSENIGRKNDKSENHIKAVLVYGYSPKNAGDMAITIGAIDVLRSFSCKVTVISRYDAYSKQFFDANEMIKKIYGDEIFILPGPFKLDRSIGYFKKASNMLRNLLVIIGIIPVGEIKDCIKHSDIVAFNGGNLFRCKNLSDMLRLIALDYPLSIARKLKRKYIIFPQSCAKINRIGNLLMRRLLSGAQTIFIRESDSVRELKEKLPSFRFTQAADLAFLIKNRYVQKPAEKRRTINVGITLRLWSIGDITEFEETTKERVFNYFIRMISANNDRIKWHIISQTEKDRSSAEIFRECVYKNTGVRVVSHVCNNPVELISIYSSFDVLIGMRLHSIILALLAGVPCYGVFFREWGNKNNGIMTDMKQKYTMIDERVELPDVSLIAMKGEETRKIVHEKIIESRILLKDSLENLLEANQRN